MAGMTKDREGFRTLFTQIPEALWEALEAEALRAGESLAKALTRILAERYGVTSEELPVPKRPGRKRKPK